MGELRTSIQMGQYIIKDGTIKNYEHKKVYFVKNKNHRKKRITLSQEEIDYILKIWDDMKYKSYADTLEIYNKSDNRKISLYKIKSTIQTHR